MIFEDSPTNPRLGPSEHNPPMPFDIFGNPKPDTELPPMPKDMYLPNFGKEKSANIEPLPKDYNLDVEPLNSEPSEEMKTIDLINKYWEAAFDQLMGLPAESFDKKLANIGELTDNKPLLANTPISEPPISQTNWLLKLIKNFRHFIGCAN